MGITIFSKKEFNSFYTLETRWNDMDSMGHINNSTYLTYYESARVDLFKQYNYKKIPFIVASIKVNYLKQLHHPSILHIGNKINKIGNTSFDIKSAIFNNNEQSASSTAIITCVSYDYIKQKPILVPDEIKDLIY